MEIQTHEGADAAAGLRRQGSWEGTGLCQQPEEREASSRPEPQQGPRLRLVPWPRPGDSKPRMWRRVALLTHSHSAVSSQEVSSDSSEQQRTLTEQFSTGLPWGHLGHLETTLLGTWGATGIYRVEASGAAKHHAGHRTLPSTKACPVPNIAVLRRRDPRLRRMHSVITGEECGISALLLQLLFELRLFQNLDFVK